MPITQLHVSGYRSIRRLTVPLKQINVLVGANGSGKSNLYRALFLVAAAANGSLARTIAEEGGLPSALWAGRRTKTEEAKIRIAVEIDEDTEYVLKFGRVAISQRPGLLGNFSNDLDIKQEQLITVNHRGKRTALVQRKGGMTTLLDVDGRTVTYPSSVAANESILTALREPHRFPELAQLRERFLACRFYHHFRLDAESPLRQPQVGILTPVMSHDGTDVACALATIMAMDGPATVHEAFEAAFPGARLIVNSECGEFDLQVKMPGVCRPFQAIELSDGTLQYACLLAALLSPRPADLLAINEPETSIHENLMEPLAQLIVHASKRSQLWITTHSRPLAAAIAKYSKSDSIELVKIKGQTFIANQKLEDDDDDYDGDG